IDGPAHAIPLLAPAQHVKFQGSRSDLLFELGPKVEVQGQYRSSVAKDADAAAVTEHQHERAQVVAVLISKLSRLGHRAPGREMVLRKRPHRVGASLVLLRSRDLRIPSRRDQLFERRLNRANRLASSSGKQEDY